MKGQFDCLCLLPYSGDRFHLWKKMDCGLCGDASLTYQHATSVVLAAHSLFLLIRDVIFSTQQFTLRAALPSSSSMTSLLSGQPNTTIYCLLLLSVWSHIFIWCTIMLSSGVLLVWCMLSCFYLVYAIMLLFGVCNHAFIWCMLPCY